MTSGARVWAEEGCPIEKSQPAMVLVYRSHLEEITAERDTLRAELAELRAWKEGVEKQEPVAWMLRCQMFTGDTAWSLSWTQSGAGMCNRLRGDENEAPLYARPVPAQSEPNIEYSVLRKFADEKRCNFIDLCNAVEQAISTGNGCPVPAQSVPDVTETMKQAFYSVVQITKEGTVLRLAEGIKAALAAAPKPEVK